MWPFFHPHEKLSVADVIVYLRVLTELYNFFKFKSFTFYPHGYKQVMRCVVQRVSSASVSVNGNVTGSIGHGLLIFLGIHTSDTSEQIDWMTQKVTKLRIFHDDDGKMNRSVMDVAGGILVISQFTLYGDARKGNRPSFIEAARPEIAIPLYEHFVADLSTVSGCVVQTGIFAAHMDVQLVNDGPVTIIIDS